MSNAEEIYLPEELEALEVDFKPLPPKPQFHQMFLLSFTEWELPTYIQVRCDTRDEGLRYVRRRKFNSCLTTECKDEEDARKQLYEHIETWWNEPSDGNNGQLIYWKIKDE